MTLEKVGQGQRVYQSQWYHSIANIVRRYCTTYRACHGSGQISTDNMEGIQYHDRHETIALQIAHPLNTVVHAKTWCFEKEDKRKLRVFEMSVLRRISRFSLRDRRHNRSIKEGLGINADIVQLVQKRRLIGRIMRMDERRLPYILLYGRLHGTRPRGRLNKRWLTT